ncbi:MAG: hypothetical protein QXU45_02090 [Candidatus Bathyarchaeia archaeon]
MKTNFRKMLKFSVLLVSSLLIATASAAYYRYLNIQGFVSVGPGGLIWVKGVEQAGTVTISGSTATVSFTLTNGTTNDITGHLYLKNLDNINHSIVINVTDAANQTYYTTFEIRIYNNATGASIAALNALSTSSYYSGTITANAVWHITFYIVTKSDASVTNDTFALQFRYE